jgi:hypothetical protein
VPATNQNAEFRVPLHCRLGKIRAGDERDLIIGDRTLGVNRCTGVAALFVPLVEQRAGRTCFNIGIESMATFPPCSFERSTSTRITTSLSAAWASARITLSTWNATKLSEVAGYVHTRVRAIPEFFGFEWREIFNLAIRHTVPRQSEDQNVISHIEKNLAQFAKLLRAVR